MDACLLPWCALKCTRHSVSVCCFAGADGPVTRGLPITNVESLWAIWNSPALQTMRQTMAETGYHPACSSRSDFTCPEVMTSASSIRIASPEQLRNRRSIERNFQQRSVTVDCYPAYIQVILDYKCNLDCGHCFQFTGRHSNVDYSLNIARMPDFDEFMAHVDTLDLIGGEATLLQSYDEIIARTANLSHMRLSLTTNGQFLETKVIPYLDRFYNLIISVDSATGEGYAKMRPSPSGNFDFDRLCTQLEILRQAKRGKNINTNATFVVCGENYQELPLFVDLAAMYEIDQINLIEVLPLDYFWLSSNKQSRLMLHKNDLPRLEDLIAETKERARELGVRVYAATPSLPN